jgi:hypothetical protein
MKVNNYLVTGANLATMGYRQKAGTTPPLDGSIMTKGEANTYYYIDPYVSPWESYPDTRAPKYQDFPCPCVGDVIVENNLAYGFSQTISYDDCSGNTYYVYLPYGQAVGIVGCMTQEPSGTYSGCGILRGSIVGARLSAITYGGCCYANYPCTTTSTTTLPQCNYNGLTVVCNAPSGYATLQWSFSETGGPAGEMVLYVNGNPIETRTSTSNGTYNVYPGDTIYVELNIYVPCGPPDTYANVYTSGNISNDANCANNAGASLTTVPYTVVSGDIGSYLVLNTFAGCDGACI